MADNPTPSTTLPAKVKKARKKPDHLKDRFSTIDRYGLGAQLIREIMQGGSSQRWEDIKHKLEDTVLQKSGMVIDIPTCSLIHYYQKVREKGFDSLTLAEYRREIADSWVKTMASIQDQFADMKVMMEKAFQEDRVGDYTSLSRSLTEVTKLMAEIHSGLNVSQIVRDKMIAQITLLFDIIKGYTFPELVENFNGHSIVPNEEAGPTRSRVSERKIQELRINLVQYIMAKMPEVSDMFRRQQFAKEDERRAGFADVPDEGEVDVQEAEFSTVGGEKEEEGDQNNAS